MEMTNRTFFSSDHHFGHGNIIKYCNRPFRHTTEMDEAIIQAHNSVVSNSDICFFLGDISFRGLEHTLNLLYRMNGVKVLVLGNHDNVVRNNLEEMRKVFEVINNYLELEVEKQKFVLSHYPMASWHGLGRGSIMLHGHCHGTWKDPQDRKILDVGVDCNNFTPISNRDIVSKLAKKVNI